MMRSSSRSRCAWTRWRADSRPTSFHGAQHPKNARSCRSWRAGSCVYMPAGGVRGLGSLPKPTPTACGLAAAAVWPGNDLEQVAIRIFEVQAAAAVTVVDRPALGLARICPVRQVLIADATERGVELFLANEKRIMLGRDILACLCEIQRDAIVGLYHEKVPEAGSRRASQGSRSGTPLTAAGRDTRRWCGSVARSRHRFCRPSRPLNSPRPGMHGSTGPHPYAVLMPLIVGPRGSLIMRSARRRSWEASLIAACRHLCLDVPSRGRRLTATGPAAAARSSLGPAAACGEPVPLEYSIEWLTCAIASRS